MVVYPFYDPNDPTTFETNHAESTRRAREERKQAELEQANRMQLIQERQTIRSQEITTLRTTLDKRVDILKKFAAKAHNLPAEQHTPFQTSLTKAMTGVYQDVDALYELWKIAGSAVQTSAEKVDAENEAKEILFGVVKAFEGTFLYETLHAQVTEHLIALFRRQMVAIRKGQAVPSDNGSGERTGSQSYRGGHSRGRGRGKRPYSGASHYGKRGKVDSSQFQIDNRPRKVAVRGLGEGVTEMDVANALTGYYGVKNIAMAGGEVVIEFEQPWQTKEPIQRGLFIKNKVGCEGKELICS